MAHMHSVWDTDHAFDISPVTRALVNQANTKVSLIQFDHNSKRFTFRIPQFVEGHDMTKCNVIQVHYINIDNQTKEQNKGIYGVDDAYLENEDEVGGGTLTFSWLISQNATKFVGPLHFLIRFVCMADDGTVEYVWNTGIYSAISVSTGMDNGDIIDDYPDIVEKWKTEIRKAV